MRIFVTGQCSLHWGRLENGNIGNYYITETTFRELHRVFPDADIVTTFQMTEDFQKRENVSVVPMELFYGWNDDDLEIALKELSIAYIYNKTGEFVSSTPFIEEVRKSDLVIDFSGEMWGYHAELVGKNRLLVGLIKDRVAQLLGKHVVLLAGSQGPFSDSIRPFAKEVYENFSGVFNREAETGKLLKSYGFNLANTSVFACPAFLFEPANELQVAGILQKEQIISTSKRTVGFVICGFNMLEGPYDKPRRDDEFIQFAESIEYIINDLGGRVVLMSHSNGFKVPPQKFELINGRDYYTVKQLYDVVLKRGKVSSDDIKCISNPYPPKITKAIIGHFDMFVTGRLHASVAAMSQCVPTVLVMHGHGPKSHKILGFTEIVGNQQYVAYPDSAESLKSKIKLCWDNLLEYRKQLEISIPHVIELAHKQFDMLKEIMDK